MPASGADDGARGNIFGPGSFSLLKGAGSEYGEVSNIHTGHGRDTSLHAHCVFCLIALLLSFLFRLHPPILTLSRKGGQRRHPERQRDCILAGNKAKSVLRNKKYIPSVKEHLNKWLARSCLLHCIGCVQLRNLEVVAIQETFVCNKGFPFVNEFLYTPSHVVGTAFHRLAPCMKLTA